ncbi:hypothetical protein QE152_g4850 [Popillia japonica]|uniref:Uncharacterized protein n=1 Tax=Popillia japonica TaxID=7064 RepID=A0AAW1N0Z9_POPJA
MEGAEALLLLLQGQPDYKGPTQFEEFNPPFDKRDESVQVNTPKRVTVCDLITTEKVLTTFTGLAKFEMVDFIVNAIKNWKLINACIQYQLRKFNIN